MDIIVQENCFVVNVYTTETKFELKLEKQNKSMSKGLWRQGSLSGHTGSCENALYGLHSDCIT